MDKLVEGHYYKNFESGELIMILKIDLESGECTSKTVNGPGIDSLYTASIDYYLFNFRYYSP